MASIFRPYLPGTRIRIIIKEYLAVIGTILIIALFFFYPVPETADLFFGNQGGSVMQIYDISRELLNSEVYPGDPVPRLQPLLRLERADECNLSALYACLHTGTHIDAPLHYLEEGVSSDELPLDHFIGPCMVIQAPERPLVGQDIDRLLPYDCTRLLIKGNQKAWLTESAASALAAEPLMLLGIDRGSVSEGELERAVHSMLLGAGMVLLEGLDLSGVIPGKYFLFAAPIKIKGAEGAPARAVLIRQ